MLSLKSLYLPFDIILLLSLGPYHALMLLLKPFQISLVLPLVSLDLGREFVRFLLLSPFKLIVLRALLHYGFRLGRVILL